MKNTTISTRQSCRGCFGQRLFHFLNLGVVPLAGGFLEQDEVVFEKKFPLNLYYCEDCGLVQVLDVINPEVLFRKYQYISSVIPSLAEHFERYSDFLRLNYLNQPNSTLLEFGCNDGILLQCFKNDTQIKAYGIDPSENVTILARGKGLDVDCRFFDEAAAKDFLQKRGRADVVTGSNVFAHADNIHEIVKSAKMVLKPEGVLVVEVHYLKDLLDKFQYDTFYHEHLCYYSVRALQNIFALQEMKLIEVMHLDMHGGGIRVIASLKSSGRKVDKSVRTFLENERGITKQFLMNFEISVKKHRQELVTLLDSIKAQNKTIVGYGAPGRGVTLLSYCQIGKKYLDYIVDVSPLRVGKLMPGVHLPIFSLEVARKEQPDYLLVLAWNYFSSIKKQELTLSKRGTKFILPFPQVEIL